MIITFSSIDILSMKQANRRKTFPFQPNPKPLARHRRKHLSTGTSIADEQGQLVAYDIIEYFLSQTFQKERIRSTFLANVVKKLSIFDQQDDLYFDQNLQEKPQILSIEEPEPPHEQNRYLEVVKVHVKNTSRYGDENNEGEYSRMSIMDIDKRDREGIIQKLKKQYSMILQSKYFSESTPIGQSRAFFTQPDPPDIVTLRKNFGKPIPPKKPLNGNKAFIKDQIRRNHKLNTIFKRSKDFVQTIDPTMTNSMTVSLIESQGAPQRGSVVTIPQEPQVVVKLSKFKEISNSIKTKQEVASHKDIPPPAPHNTKLINLIAEQQRQALKQRLQRSFHSNDRTKLREVTQSELKSIRPNNAISVSFLPRLSRV